MSSLAIAISGVYRTLASRRPISARADGRRCALRVMGTFSLRLKNVSGKICADSVTVAVVYLQTEAAAA